MELVECGLLRVRSPPGSDRMANISACPRSRHSPVVKTGGPNRHSSVALTRTGHRTKSCGLLAPGKVRSCGLLRLVMSCGLLGLTPGAHPAVVQEAEDMFGLLGPVVPDPVDA